MDIKETTASLGTKQGYFDRFYEIKGVELSDKAAYLKLEEEYQKTFGTARYSSYGSFRVMKHHYLKLLIRKRVVVNKVNT